MIKSFHLFFSICFLIFGSSLYAQRTKVTQDFGGWFSIALEKEIINELYLTVEKEGRFEKNISKLDEHFLQVGISYEKIEFLRLEADLRFTEKIKGENVYEKEYRYNFDITLIKEINRFKGLYRIRYQNDDKDFFNYKTIDEEEHNIRNRLEVRYNVPKIKLEPYVNSEIFYEFDKELDPIFSKYRILLGARYDINKNNQLKLFFMLERELNAILPYHFYTIGLNYKYKI